MNSKKEAIAEVEKNLTRLAHEKSVILSAQHQLGLVIDSYKEEDPVLKRCPWCGGEAEIEYTTFDPDYESQSLGTANYVENYKGERDAAFFYIRCGQCGARQGRGRGPTKAEASVGWNIRCIE